MKCTIDALTFLNKRFSYGTPEYRTCLIHNTVNSSSYSPFVTVCLFVYSPIPIPIPCHDKPELGTEQEFFRKIRSECQIEKCRKNLKKSKFNYFKLNCCFHFCCFCFPFFTYLSNSRYLAMYVLFDRISAQYLNFNAKEIPNLNLNFMPSMNLRKFKIENDGAP